MRGERSEMDQSRSTPRAISEIAVSVEEPIEASGGKGVALVSYAYTVRSLERWAESLGSFLQIKVD